MVSSSFTVRTREADLLQIGSRPYAASALSALIVTGVAAVSRSADAEPLGASGVLTGCEDGSYG